MVTFTEEIFKGKLHFCVVEGEILFEKKMLCIAQKIKFSVKAFLSKCDHMRRKFQFRLHLLKKTLMENFIFVQCWLCFLSAYKTLHLFFLNSI